jgi:uroporphyrinogen decarboxylase
MADFSNRDTMTPKERIMALTAGEAVDRVPFDPLAAGFSARIYGIDRGEFYRNPEKAFAAGIYLMETYPWMDFLPSYGWADRGVWEFGGKILWPDGNRFAAPVSPKPIVSVPNDVDILPDPDVKRAGMNPLVARFNAISRKHGFPASLPGGTPTTLSAAIAGRENFLRWLIRYPEAIHKLQRKVTDFIIKSAEITIKQHGPENCSLYCGVPMETNQLISSKTFETFAKPYIKEILGYYVSEGIRTVMVHLCGDHTDNLVHWADIPLPPRTIFSIGHEMDLEKTGQFLGSKHILAGNINNTIIQTGSSREIVEEVRRCLGIGMNHTGGFILMPACELPPDTPRMNMEVLAQALYEYGFY